MKTDPTQTLDLAIVGGGINGAGLAFLAARAGLSVALFEKGDWAQGTSSRSTKLIHGGIRYLEQARFSLVREALKERRSLLADAPHLVRPIPILLPVYREDKRPPWMLRVGLFLYDRLAGKQNMRRHEWLAPSKAILRAPSLRSDGLLGCGVYWDAQANDARLVWESVWGAREAGAFCASGAEVVSAAESPEGWNLKVRMQDGVKKEFLARCVADASGPWANRTAKLWSRREGKKIRPTRGSHLVVPQVLAQDAVLVTAPDEKRILFVIPWRGCTLVGTTDVDDPAEPDDVRCTEEERDYLLRHAARLFPKEDWSPRRVIASFAGLRPLAWTGGKGHASSVSREDRITAEGRIVTILGGKLTTYRSMARKALALVYRVLGRAGAPPPDTRLPGSPLEPWDSFLDRARREWPAAYGVTEDQALHLAGLYGGRAVAVLEPIRQRPDLAKPLCPGRPEIAAQILFAVQREDARNLDDILLRRLEIGFSPQRREAAEPASRLAAEALGWDEAARQAEVKRYLDLLEPKP